MVVGVGKESGKYLHHAGIDLLLLGRALVPRLDIGVVARKLGVRRDDAQLLLAFEHHVPVLVPAHVELALVLVRPLLGHVVRRVRRAWARDT